MNCAIRLKAGTTGAADLAASLRKRLDPGELAESVPLAGLGRWRIGGPADVVVTPRSVAALAHALDAIRAAGARYVIVGDGSNLLFDDAGYRGAVVRIGRALGAVQRLSVDRVAAGAGAWVPTFARQLINWGLGGAVHAIGIPGTVGGLVAMNGGSQRQGIGEHVEAVALLDPDGALRWVAAAALGFGHRCSALQATDKVMVAARFRLERGESSALRREALAILAARRAKFPRTAANCGSVFVSDPRLYAAAGSPGAAIERAGLKGLAIGGARIAREHANFIVNEGGATAADVLALIGRARDTVAAQTGIAMAAEVRFLPAEGTPVPAHEALALAIRGACA